MGRSYVRRGSVPPRYWEPKVGDVVYIEGTRTTIKRVGTSDGTPYVWIRPAVRGTFAMSVANLKQVARVQIPEQGNPGLSSRWHKAKIRRLPGGKVQVKVFGAGGRRNPAGGGLPALSKWSRAPDPDYGNRLLYWFMTDVGEYQLKPRHTIKGNRPVYSVWRGNVFISNQHTAAKAAAAARMHHKWYRATKG